MQCSALPQIASLKMQWSNPALIFTHQVSSTNHCTALHCTALQNFSLHSTLLHSTAQHITAQHYTAPHCTFLNYCSARSCTKLAWALHFYTALLFITLSLHYTSKDKRWLCNLMDCAETRRGSPVGDRSFPMQLHHLIWQKSP